MQYNISGTVAIDEHPMKKGEKLYFGQIVRIEGFSEHYIMLTMISKGEHVGNMACFVCLNCGTRIKDMVQTQNPSYATYEEVYEMLGEEATESGKKIFRLERIEIERK